MSDEPADARLRVLQQEAEAQLRAADEQIAAITAARADANSDDVGPRPPVPARREAV
ncbi:hypothetical protein [uncultured Amnibacterium sp.]|uniref:hypothetical protein n=1 Tax=uncultured Amnibacterium sp. TaxID=1631851 RepID=UPI0035CA9C33